MKNSCRHILGFSISVFFFFSSCLVLIPPLIAKPEINFDKKAFKEIYEEGRTRFHRILREKSDGHPLSPKDRRLLENVEKEIPLLYEHVMSYYFFLHRLNEKGGYDFHSRFLETAGLMAEEFVQSIPRGSLRRGLSPLQALLHSTGYFSKSYPPNYRRFARSVARSVKSQRILEELGLRQVHSLAEGEKVRLAIIDSGIDPTIREIRSRVASYKNFLDRSRPIGDKGKYPFDWGGHGTSVASIIYQVAPKAELMIIKVYEGESMNNVPFSRWTAYLFAAGMIWAAQNGADIINVSAAFRAEVPAIREASRFCWENNVLVISSMGNVLEDGKRRGPFFPAYYPWTIAVGGTENAEKGFKVWRRSTFGNYIDVVAPAKNLRVEHPSYRGLRRGARIANGNSLATAFVTGTAALVLSAMDRQTVKNLREDPGKLCETLRQILRQTASNEKLGYETPNPFSGYGMIEIQKAVRMARAISPGVENQEPGLVME